jgi:hypothetical protein
LNDLAPGGCGGRLFVCLLLSHFDGANIGKQALAVAVWCWWWGLWSSVLQVDRLTCPCRIEEKKENPKKKEKKARSDVERTS